MNKSIAPICPKCNNNLCVLYPEIFAHRHLRGAGRDCYEAMKKALDDFLLEQMQRHKDSILSQQIGEH